MMRLFSSFPFRAVIVGAAGLCLSMLPANASAQSTRPYQMSMLSSTDPTTAASSDLPIFDRVFAAKPQPAGRSIAWLPPNADLDQYDLDWTRIAAVYVDEPYLALVKNSNYCDPPGVPARAITLQAMAAALREKAPAARFWVNFSSKEYELMHDHGCPLNMPYIDVISTYDYDIAFAPTLSARYQWLFEHRQTSYQQLALVAGTFTGGGHSALLMASRLSGYFTYAAAMNQSCNLPLGATGITGLYDGCPVWMLAGWIGGVTAPADALWVRPLDHTDSLDVFIAWQAGFALRRVDPVQVRRTLELIPLWFND